MTDNLVNEDFQNELRALNNSDDKVNTLKAPLNNIQSSKSATDISTTALFGKNVLDGQLPELSQDFIIQKSKQDKLVEMGTIAQEVYETKVVSRGQMVSLESIARELLPDESAATEERKVIVSDHEVNMFTEDASKVESELAINNTQVTIDRIVGDLRNSAIALGDQLVKTAQSDQIERKERLYKSISDFNQASITFLKETEKDSLESVELKFTRDLRWGDLMSVPVDILAFNFKDDAEGNKRCRSFTGTSAESLVKDLTDFLNTSSNAYSVIRNFVKGTVGIVRNPYESTELINKKEDNKFNFQFTIGDVFKSFGDSRFALFYSNLDDNINTQITAAKSAVELLNGKTDIAEIMELTNELHNQQKSIMDTAGNMAVLNHVQYLIVKFLSSF